MDGWMDEQPHRPKLTSASPPPNSSRPLSVCATSHTLTSHAPPSLRATVAPRARPTTWCPKHTPMRRTRSCASTVRTKATSRSIHGSLSKALCPVCVWGAGVSLVFRPCAVLCCLVLSHPISSYLSISHPPPPPPGTTNPQDSTATATEKKTPKPTTPGNQHRIHLLQPGIPLPPHPAPLPAHILLRALRRIDDVPARDAEARAGDGGRVGGGVEEGGEEAAVAAVSGTGAVEGDVGFEDGDA